MDGPSRPLNTIVSHIPVMRGPPLSPPVVLPAPPATSVIARDWIEYWDLVAKGVAVSAPLSGRVGKTPDIIPQEVEEVATIGSVLGDLATTYIQTRYAPPSYPMGNPNVIFANQPSAPPIMAGAGMDIPFVDVIPESMDPCKKQVWDPRGNCGTGKWINRGRRRRRRLATASDISDLSSLKTVLGPKGLQNWIATRGRG